MQSNMRRKIISLLFWVGVLFAVVTLIIFTVPEKSMHIGSRDLSVLVVENPLAAAQGLAGRERLVDNQGMAFRFVKPGMYSFWMKGMLIPLDFVWISGDTVIGFTENVPAPSRATPDSMLAVLAPPAPADVVLEVPAGWVSRNGLRAGDRVSW